MKIVCVIILMTILKIEDFDFGNTLVDEKWYKNISIYDISYKTLIGAKLLCIWVDKVDVFIKKSLWWD